MAGNAFALELWRLSAREIEAPEKPVVQCEFQTAGPTCLRRARVCAQGARRRHFDKYFPGR
eukprot:1161534-Alexandrium_andersonii.AAC.1